MSAAAGRIALEPLTADELSVAVVMQVEALRLGRPLSLEQISKALGLKSRTGAWRQVGKLRRKGWLRNTGNGERLALVLTRAVPIPVELRDSNAVAAIALASIEQLHAAGNAEARPLALRLLSTLRGEPCPT
jgi:biotin operon repressor